MEYDSSFVHNWMFYKMVHSLCCILNIECVTHFKKLVIICNISGLQGIYFMKTVNILECEGNETREISVEYKILMLLIPYPVVCDDGLS